MHEGNTSNTGHLQEVLPTRAARQDAPPTATSEYTDREWILRFKEEISPPRSSLNLAARADPQDMYKGDASAARHEL